MDIFEQCHWEFRLDLIGLDDQAALEAHLALAPVGHAVATHLREYLAEQAGEDDDELDDEALRSAEEILRIVRDRTGQTTHLQPHTHVQAA